jgi:hypothetical protein
MLAAGTGPRAVPGDARLARTGQPPRNLSIRSFTASAASMATMWPTPGRTSASTLWRQRRAWLTAWCGSNVDSRFPISSSREPRIDWSSASEGSRIGSSVPLERTAERSAHESGIRATSSEEPVFPAVPSGGRARA